MTTIAAIVAIFSGFCFGLFGKFRNIGGAIMIKDNLFRLFRERTIQACGKMGVVADPSETVRGGIPFANRDYLVLNGSIEQLARIGALTKVQGLKKAG